MTHAPALDPRFCTCGAFRHDIEHRPIVEVRIMSLGPGALPAQGAARSTDPATSSAAARSVDPRGQHREIMRLLRELGSANRYEIASAGRLTEYQVGRRLSELEQAGLIQWTGVTRAGSTGRSQRVFEVRS